MTQPPQGPWPAHDEGNSLRGEDGFDDAPAPTGVAQSPSAAHARLPQANDSRRRKSAGVIIATCLCAVSVLVLGAVAIGELNSHGDGPLAKAGFQSSPAEPPQRRIPPSGSVSPSSVVSREPTANGDSAPSSAGPQKILKLADHPILQDPAVGLKNRACNLPAWQGDQAVAEAFFTAARTCLDEAWGPFLAYYKLPFVQPALHFPTGASFDTACGNIQVGIATAAYYCKNNLYVPFRGLQTDQYGNNPGVYLALFAHEYGHHVQEVAGLMDAVWLKIYEVGPASQAGLELSRRKELQAQCFSGMFLSAHVDQGGTVTRAMLDKAWNDQETRGDNTSGSHDHGTNAHYASWWRVGAKSNRIADCNTFAANSSTVS